MVTTVKIESMRFVRRADSGVISNTAWMGGMASVLEKLDAAEWQGAPETVAQLPVNDPTKTSFSETAFDAYRQSGNAASNSGKQTVFAGMAAYRIRMPDEAMGTYATRVSFRAFADKFCVGGADFASVKSDTGDVPALPETWDVTGALAETAATISASVNRSGAFEIELSGTDAKRYVFLFVRLSDYTAHRREYWVEGSAAIDGPSIAVTFADAINEPAASADVAYPSAAAFPIVAKFAAAPTTITNPYLRLVYASRMLNGGRLADSATPTPTPETGPAYTLSPSVRHISGGVEARGVMAEIHAPRTLSAGRTMWLRSISAMLGASPVRVSVINSDTQPDAADPATWNGSAKDCIGTGVASGVGAGEYVAVPITRDTTASRVWVVASIEEVSESDAAALLVGWQDMQGLDIINSHISRHRYSPAAAPTLSGWAAFASGGEDEGIIFPALLPGGAILGSEDKYAISEGGSAAPGATSAGTWRQLADGAYAAPMSVVRARGHGFIGLSANSGAVCVSGDPGLGEGINGAELPANNVDIFSVMDGFMLVRPGGTVEVFGAYATPLLESAVSGWTGVSKVRVYRGFVVAVRHDGGVYARGFPASAITQLEALTNVADVRMSGNRLIVLFDDGTASAWEHSSGNIGSAPLATWSGCYSIAATLGASWAINDTGIVSNGLALATDFYDPSKIPAGATPTVIIGSEYRRLAVAYVEAGD